jgi:photosystem II stability/assembly factor-like uncharacterized protein
MAGRSRVVGNVLLSCFALLLCRFASAAPWVPVGPDGGDARRISSDPHDPQHLFLGTANGWFYQSRDAGANWERLARPGQRDDLVLDSLVMDPRDSKHITVGAWVIGSPDGGVYMSHDGGVTWTAAEEMHSQSVRALASSRSNPDLMVAGTLQGIFESSDSGQHWTQISPKGSKEIHEIESIAIDPVDPNVIYAGTWHLPWKTTDGGKTWANIKQGIIDDSDVFSIIVDPAAPKTVYASACSGIYKSLDAGELFKKVQGIPSTARRTRVLLQDPSHADVVFAGTTEGLWRTTDGGAKWARLTGPEVIVNDVWVSPTNSKRVMLATDRQGIQLSDDGGESFKPANTGFSARQITSVLRDPKNPDRLWVGVVNDKQAGGVFESDNGAQSWKHLQEGLNGQDVFSLGQAADGAVIAGTAHGIYLLDASAQHWSRMDSAVMSIPGPVPPEAESLSTSASVKSTAPHASKNKLTPKQRRIEAAAEYRRTLEFRRKHSADIKAAAAQRTAALKNAEPKMIAKNLDGPVYAIALSGDRLLALTSLGLLTSNNNGSSWELISEASAHDWHRLAANGQTVVAAGEATLSVSSDAGSSWGIATLPDGLTSVAGIAVDSTGEIWIGGPQGDFVSSDVGKSWTRPKGAYTTSVADVDFDPFYNRVYVSTGGPDSMVFEVQLPEKLVVYTRSGWNLRSVRQVKGRLIGSTRFDGIVAEPKDAASALGAAQSPAVPYAAAIGQTAAPRQ